MNEVVNDTKYTGRLGGNRHRILKAGSTHYLLGIDEFSRLPPLAGVPGATPVKLRPVITHPEATVHRTIDGVLINKGSIKVVSANVMEDDAVLNGEHV